MPIVLLIVFHQFIKPIEFTLPATLIMKMYTRTVSDWLYESDVPTYISKLMFYSSYDQRRMLFYYYCAVVQRSVIRRARNLLAYFTRAL